MAKEPAGSPLAGPPQLQFGKPKAHDLTVRHCLGGAIFGKQSHRFALGLSVLKDLDGFLPTGLLLIVDLAQIQNVPLDDSVGRPTPVLDDAPVAVFFAVFLSGGAAQKHNSRVFYTTFLGWK